MTGDPHPTGMPRTASRRRLRRVMDLERIEPNPT